MAELAQAPAASEGTPVSAPEGTPVSAPVTDEGHAQVAEGSSATGNAAAAPETQQEESFFDRSKLPPELLPAYKEMQSAWTKRMQAISQDRELLEQAKAFTADPIGNMQRIAQQYGYQLTRAEAAAALQQPQSQEWQPQTWDEVLNRAKEVAKQEILREFQPIIGNVQKLQAQNIEAQLEGLDPQWRTYEDSMRDNLKRHPTLVNDVGTLYRLSVPQEVIEARATQAALSRMQRTTQSAKVSGTSTARSSVPAPRAINSFADAVEAAREQLGKR